MEGCFSPLIVDLCLVLYRYRYLSVVVVVYQDGNTKLKLNSLLNSVGRKTTKMSEIFPSGNRRVTKKAAPPLPPVEGGCHFYIPKKNRYCKMVPGKNQRYCGEHIMNESGDQVPANKLRVPCPIDPSHTCFQNQLKKHLAICNARLEDQPPGRSQRPFSVLVCRRHLRVHR